MNEQQTQNAQRIYNIVVFVTCAILIICAGLCVYTITNQQRIGSNPVLSEQYRAAQQQIESIINNLKSESAAIREGIKQLEIQDRQRKENQLQLEQSYKQLEKQINSLSAIINQAGKQSQGITSDSAGIRETVERIRNLVNNGMVGGSD